MSCEGIDGGESMSSKLAGNVWGEILHHESNGILELRWLPGKMTDGAFKATLALYVWEAEKVRPSFLLIDATQFRHQFGPNVMQWRDDCIIPRYGAAGAKNLPSTFRRDSPAQSRKAVKRFSSKKAKLTQM